MKLCCNCHWKVKVPFSIGYCSRPRYASDLSLLDWIKITHERDFPPDGKRCGQAGLHFTPKDEARAA